MNRYFSVIAFLLISCSSSAADVVVVEKESPIVQDEVLSENVGIEMLGGVLTPILESGCKLPCKLSQIFSTAEDNQNQITITLVRGLPEASKDGVKLGRYKIIGIEPAQKGTPQIKVVFGASKGQIWLSVSDAAGQSDIRITRIE